MFMHRRRSFPVSPGIYTHTARRSISSKPREPPLPIPTKSTEVKRKLIKSNRLLLDATKNHDDKTEKAIYVCFAAWHRPCTGLLCAYALTDLPNSRTDAHSPWGGMPLQPFDGAIRAFILYYKSRFTIFFSSLDVRHLKLSGNVVPNVFFCCVIVL